MEAFDLRGFDTFDIAAALVNDELTNDWSIFGVVQNKMTIVVGFCIREIKFSSNLAKLFASTTVIVNGHAVRIRRLFADGRDFVQINASFASVT